MKRSAWLSKQTLMHGIDLLLLVVFVLGIVTLINYLAYQHNRRVDLSPDKTFSLSSRTRQVLDSLEHDVQATIFYDQQEGRAYHELMQLFAWASERFHYTFIDINKNPAKAQAFNISRKGAGIIEYMGKKEKVLQFEEHSIVNTLIRLMDTSVKTVRFTTGHGEKALTSQDPELGCAMIRQALEAENFKVAEILLMQQQRIPKDTMLLVICGPKKDFLTRELDMIDVYLKNGGRVMLLCDPFPLPEVEKYMRQKGVSLSRDFVIDKKSKLFALDHMTPIVIPDRTHAIAEYMNDAVVFPVCRSVFPVAAVAAAQKTAVIAKSSPDSWAERDTQSVYAKKAVFDKGKDISGPVPVALVTEIDGGAERPGLLMVFGDSDFITNYYHSILGNRDFFLNAVNWFAEKEVGLAPRPRPAQSPMSILFLTKNESRLIFWSAVVIEPLLVLLAGLSVILWRRFKR